VKWILRSRDSQVVGKRLVEDWGSVLCNLQQVGLVDGWSWSSSAMLDEVIFLLVCIDNLSCKALPITASRSLRANRVEVCRKLEGLKVARSYLRVELHRKSSSRNTSTGRSQDVVLLHEKLRCGSKW